MLRVLANALFFECSDLKSVSFPDSVTSIDKSAFRRCFGLESVTIPDSVTSINEAAFSECTRLRSLSIGKSIKIIGPHSFSLCSRLSIVTIESVEEIGSFAWATCTHLKTLMFEEGSNLKSIGVQAFSGCYNLNAVNLPDSLTELKAGAFFQCFAIFDVKI